MPYLEEDDEDEDEEDTRRVSALVCCSEILPLKKSFSQEYASH